MWTSTCQPSRASHGLIYLRTKRRYVMLFVLHIVQLRKCAQVSERLRKLVPEGKRAFSDMKEITHMIPQYGQYNHRGEMGEVRRLMDSWGVGEDFGAVVLNSGS
jgi:hypothetical protein